MDYQQEKNQDCPVMPKETCPMAIKGFGEYSRPVKIYM